uniref:Putative ROK family protein n=1 Tax=mine drainage metagenome TaxID=410659 RepID=E6QHL6_9ZZZZ
MSRTLSRSTTRRPCLYPDANRTTTATPQTIRHVNRSILLNLIRLHQPISRAELSRITGMHRSNVSVNIEELIAEGLLREERAKPIGRGRAPFSLHIREDSLYVLAVNLRVSETTIALGQLSGRIEKFASFETPKDPGLFVQMLDREVRRLLMPVRPSLKKLVRNLTVSVPGHIRSKTQGDIWMPALPGYSGFSLRSAIEDRIGIPTEVMNNASLGALAEMWLDELQHVHLKDFVFLLIGDVGAGSGLVFNHQLYLGHDLTYAGEFGHMVIDPAGPKCPCGKNGCWQLYVCDRATWDRYQPTKPFTAAGFQQFLQKAKKRDPRVIAALYETARYMALGISNISQALNPEVVIFGGEITGLWDVLQPEITRQLSQLNTTTAIRPTQDNIDQLFLQGAIQLGLRRIFDPPAMR